MILLLIGWIALFVGILLQPLALIYKLTSFGVDYGISHLFYLMYLTIAIWSALNTYFFLLKINLSLLSMISLLFTLFFLLFFNIEGSTPLLIGLLYMILSLSFGFSLFLRTGYKFVLFMIYTGLFLCIIGWILYLFNLPLFDPVAAGGELFFMNNDGHYRAIGVFMNPNNFGYFIVFIFCLILPSKNIRLVYKIVLCTFLFYLIYITGSRSSMGAVLIAYFIHFLFIYFNKSFRFFIYVILLFLVVGMLLIIFNLNNILDVDVRAEKWIAGWQVYTTNIDYILFGVPFEIDLSVSSTSFSDNFFLLVLFRLGFFGFAFFILFYFAAIVIATKSLRANCGELERGMALFVISSFILMFLSNFILLVPSNIFFGMSVGVLMLGNLYRAKTSKVLTLKASPNHTRF